MFDFTKQGISKLGELREIGNLYLFFFFAFLVKNSVIEIKDHGERKLKYIKRGMILIVAKLRLLENINFNSEFKTTRVSIY